jgi:phospholipid-translocating ATPase
MLLLINHVLLFSFQNIVPISLYISVEAVRTCQAAFIYFDKDIWYEKTNQATLARTWNLSDDLGQIEYIFSDKTGTLTQVCFMDISYLFSCIVEFPAQNSMVFRHCSVGGKVYRGDPEPAEGEQEKKVLRLSDAETSSGSGSAALELTDVKLPAGVLRHFRDQSLKNDLAAALAADVKSENASHARNLNGFFTVLALCHTVLASVNLETDVIEYKAQSPDEAALVQAAADVGFVFRGRDREILRLQTPFSEEVERYELLNILEFTSARKRMSVVLRKLDPSDNRLFLLTKGADNVIFERLKAGSDDLKRATEEQLDEFANEGLRTLTLAYKIIPGKYIILQTFVVCKMLICFCAEGEYESWSERYNEAMVAMDDREGKIERVSEELERDLRLLGATAIEDRLQDGVPETIADLKRAGIKIWVATGDKLETAIG